MSDRSCRVAGLLSFVRYQQNIRACGASAPPLNVTGIDISDEAIRQAAAEPEAERKYSGGSRRVRTLDRIRRDALVYCSRMDISS